MMDNFKIETISGKEGVYKISRKSSYSGEMNSMELKLDMGALESWMRGESLIQNAFPHLSADEREFIMTGITAKEWDEIFG